MKAAGAAAGIGAVFGFAISWGWFADPDAIRDMLLLRDLYLWKMFALAVAVAFVGVRLVRGRRSVVTHETIEWATARPQRRHVTGAALFGTGWAVAAACPAPIAAQLGQGVVWSLFTLAGVATGVLVYVRRHAGAPEAEVGPDTPATNAPAPLAPATSRVPAG